MRRKRELPPKHLPKWYGKHPNPTEPEQFDTKVPGNVEEKTVRESNLRRQLRAGQTPAAEDFEAAVKVFAQRARNKVKYLTVQRRVWVTRAKRWAQEMILQDLEPSQLTVQILFLACGSLGDMSGALWWKEWMDRVGRPIGRLEFNCLIEACGVDGRPIHAYEWLEKMKEAGIDPDPKSYAGVVEGWEKIGNRKEMLRVLLEMRRAEADGKLAEPRIPEEIASPYLPLVRSYTKVADAPRALSVLKSLQARHVPLTYEAHLLRLEAHLRVQEGPRRSLQEIERALVDSLLTRPAKRFLFHGRMARMCRFALGNQRYEEILEEVGASEEELVPELPGADAVKQYRKARIQTDLPLINRGHKRYNPLDYNNHDRKYFQWRLAQRRGVKMGETKAGFRKPSQEGMPEWMTIEDPEKFGY